MGRDEVMIDMGAVKLQIVQDGGTRTANRLNVALHR